MYHVEVLADVKKDLASADRAARERIQDAITTKLATNPQGYGDRLSGDLAGFWKLRVGRYRIVYEILEHHVVVLVLGAGKRSEGDREDVYVRLTRSKLARRRRRHGIRDDD